MFSTTIAILAEQVRGANWQIQCPIASTANLCKRSDGRSDNEPGTGLRRDGYKACDRPVVVGDLDLLPCFHGPQVPGQVVLELRNAHPLHSHM
jgi:hypothetical protein